MDDKFLSMLGLSRRAGKFSSGHDAAFASIEKGKASVCFLTSDASERLKDEFRRTSVFNGRELPCIELDYSMNEIWAATHCKAAVFTVNDDGFARKLLTLLQQ